jgi:hypothetical protein
VSEQQWDPREIAEFGKTNLDIYPFVLGYTDMAVHLSEERLRAEFRTRFVYVGPRHRSLTRKFDETARLFLEEAAKKFFADNKSILGWWQSSYAGAQLWVHSNGVAGTSAIVQLPEQLRGDRGIFSTNAVLHRGELAAQRAYVEARTKFIAATSAVQGWELYVNESGRIDVKR